MTERKMATIRTIDNIEPIEGADLIQVATIGGWKVVVKKGDFDIGQLAVYCEIDSFIPTTIAPFLTRVGHHPKVFNSVEGERLKTVRLRGQVSQGLLLPLTGMRDWDLYGPTDAGTDVSELLGIVKYEAPISAQLAGIAKGNFPSNIPKTDQERIQNLTKELAFWQEKRFTWTVSEKCEGSSFTGFVYNSEFNVCSRNLMLKEDENNTLWKTALKYDLKNKLLALNMNIAIQAEIIGPGIQGNIYQLKDHMLAVFDIYDIDKQEYLYPADKKTLIEKLGMVSVPIFDLNYSLKGKTVADLLAFAEGKSVMGMIGCEREGLVFNCNECHASFKVVSNRYLLKHGD